MQPITNQSNKMLKNHFNIAKTTHCQALKYKIEIKKKSRKKRTFYVVCACLSIMCVRSKTTTQTINFL